MSNQVDAVGVYLTAVQRACFVLNHGCHPGELQRARRALARVAPGHYLLPVLAQKAPDLSSRVAAFRHRAVHDAFGTCAAVLAIGFVKGLGLYAAALEFWFDRIDREAAQIAGGLFAAPDHRP